MKIQQLTNFVTTTRDIMKDINPNELTHMKTMLQNTIEEITHEVRENKTNER